MLEAQGVPVRPRRPGALWARATAVPVETSGGRAGTWSAPAEEQEGCGRVRALGSSWGSRGWKSLGSEVLSCWCWMGSSWTRLRCSCPIPASSRVPRAFTQRGAGRWAPAYACCACNSCLSAQQTSHRNSSFVLQLPPLAAGSRPSLRALAVLQAAGPCCRVLGSGQR